MSFGEAIRTVFNKYADFSGRARRSEFWWYSLFLFIVVIVVDVIDLAVGKPVFFAVAILATLIPSLAVTVRRLHDTGRSGWWILIGLVPLIGGIVLLVFECMDSQPGQNSYGPSPKGLGFGQPDPGYPTQYGR